MLKDKKILLIISGGVAAYKSLELIRLLKKNNAVVRCILTEGGAQFITPLSVASLSQNKVYTDLWSLTDEAEMGHIRLSRENDLIIIAPASADIIAKTAHGLANDLASTCILASDKPIMIVPSMNPCMWENQATQHNISILKSRGIKVIEPDCGEMACGETGQGRMAEPAFILETIQSFFFEKPLKGIKALVTAGPTYEPLDPVRFLGNRSSGKQGYALAEELRNHGADVTLISGVTSLPRPAGIKYIQAETASEMLESVLNALPADIAVCAAAVSDWRPEIIAAHKIKKKNQTEKLEIQFTQTEDILKAIAQHKSMRPKLVIGFAAETENLLENAKMKLSTKGCDRIIANEVGKNHDGEEKVFGSDFNNIHWISSDTAETSGHLHKNDIAKFIVLKIIQEMKREK